MKKILVSLCLLMTAGLASAQVAFGIKAGFQSSLGFDQNWNFSTESLKIKSQDAYGFDAGLFLRAGRRFYGQLEVNYSYEASKCLLEGQDLASTTTEPTAQDILKQSVNIPVLFGVKLIDMNVFNLRVMIGPTFNFNIGNAGAIEYTDVNSELRPCSFGLDCGLGFDFWMFALDVRYRLVQPGYTYRINEMELNTNPVNSFELSLAWKIFDKTK